MAKICHITSAHQRYDIRIFVKECITLAANGHNVSLIVADGLADEIKNQVHIYSVAKPLNRKKRMQQSTWDIYKKVLNINPDFVHFHDPELIFMAHKLVKAGYKVIYDVHEDLPKQVLNKHWLPKFSRKIISNIAALVEKQYAKKFYGIVAATPIIGRRFKLYNNNTIDLCNYPILAELDLAYTSWDNRQDSMCYIGSISQTRGIMPVIAACAISHIPLELAGMFSGDISLDKLQKLDGSQYVHYRGVLDRQEITNLLQKVKIGMVTLLPTPSYVESLPIKMFEYMLAGIPLIASNFPLWREIVAKYDCGILVDPNNPGQIAVAAAQILSDGGYASQMGLNGRNAVLEHFNWEHEQQKLIDFYK